jgi:hypothetical protein
MGGRVTSARSLVAVMLQVRVTRAALFRAALPIVRVGYLRFGAAPVPWRRTPGGQARDEA